MRYILSPLLSTYITTHITTRLIRSRTLVSVAVLLLVLIGIANPVASQVTDLRDQKKQKISKDIKQYKINIGRLQEGIKKQEEQIRLKKKVELTLLTELQDIDSRLTEQNFKIQTMADRIEAQHDVMAEKNEALNNAGESMKRVQNHVIKRMQSFYKLGELGLVNVTFSNQTLPELLRFQDSFLALIKYDRDAIDRYRATITELEQAMESIQLQDSIFQELLEENRVEQQKLDGIKQEKELLLTKIRTQTKLHEQAAAEMEAATDTLTDSIKGMKQQVKKIDQSFLYGKGKLPPPVKGEVITRFKENTTNLLGISSVSNGIAINAPSGSSINAIHEGVVHYAGYLRGFGNTVIVNHGHQYYSITSRMERLLVKKDQQVNEKTAIGIMGDIATLVTPGLYFELRKDTDQLDPLEWLDASKLK